MCLAKSVGTAVTTTHEAASVAALVVVPLVGALVGAVVEDVGVGLGDVGLDTIQGFQLEVIGLFVVIKGHKSMGAV